MLIMMDYLLTSFERKYSAITKSNLKIITTEDIEYEYQTRNNNTILLLSSTNGKFHNKFFHWI